jgi:hypothetical protein
LKQSKNMNNLTNQTSLTRLKEIYGTLSKQATDTTHNKHICYKLDK